VPALVGGFDPGTLRRLDPTDNPLRNDGAAARVKVRNQSDNTIGKAGAAALAGSTFPGLTKLILTDCGLAAAELNALAAAFGNRVKF